MASQIALFSTALIAIFLLFKIITAPIKFIYKLVINLASGYLLLFLFNLFSGFTGFILDLNLISAALIGLLGLPGLALLLIVRFFLLL